MTADAFDQPFDTVVSDLGEMIARLERRRHVVSARLDLALREGCWVAQILADPLYRPRVGKGDTTVEALIDLHLQTAGIDWRRVRR